MPLGAVIFVQKCSRHQCDGTVASSAYPFHYAPSFTSISTEYECERGKLGSHSCAWQCGTVDFVRCPMNMPGQPCISCLVVCSNFLRMMRKCPSRVQGLTKAARSKTPTVIQQSLLSKLTKSNKPIKLVWTSACAHRLFLPIKSFSDFSHVNANFIAQRMIRTSTLALIHFYHTDTDTSLVWVSIIYL